MSTARVHAQGPREPCAGGAGAAAGSAPLQRRAAAARSEAACLRAQCWDGLAVPSAAILGLRSPVAVRDWLRRSRALPRRRPARAVQAVRRSPRGRRCTTLRCRSRGRAGGCRRARSRCATSRAPRHRRRSGPPLFFPGILAITQSAKLGGAVVTRAASTARCDPATGLARPHAALGRGARGERGAGGAGRRAASGAPAAAAAGGAAAGPGHRDQGARLRVRAAQPDAVCPRCMSTCVDERLKAAASPHSLCRIVHHRCLCHDPSGRHHAALLEASEREASGGERPPYASLGPQRCWARARGQERFNAEFEALRQRKRGCLEQLRAAQRRMAELAAQAAALGGGLGADGELAFAALQDCEQPDSVLTVQARGRRRRAHAVHMSWLG